VWRYISITFLGLFALGNIESLGSSAKDIGVYGTSTGGVVEIFFFLVVAAVVFITLKNYFE
jgi:hypothetical protein